MGLAPDYISNPHPMQTQVNLAQNAFIELRCTDRYVTASIATGAGANAGAVFVVQVETLTGEFVTLKIYNAVTRADASNITGPSQFGYCDIPGAQRVRVTRTDAAGGNGTVGLSLIGRQ